MKNPLISVVMGVYNPSTQEKLEKAVNSILRQTFRNFEFIICDDGSNIITKKWLQQIAKIDWRIRILENDKNVGLAATLNRCISEAKGVFIARQDADDYSHPERFEKQLAFLCRHNRCAFVGSNIHYFSEMGIWGQFRYPQYPQKVDFLWVSPFCHGSILFRKEVLEKVGLYRISKETLRCEDYDLFMRIYLEGYYAANLQENLYYFCEDEAAVRRRKLFDRIDEMKVRAKYFGKLGLYPKGLLFLLKPLAVGILPPKFLSCMKDIVYQRKYKNK